jgi:hypothetical protein
MTASDAYPPTETPQPGEVNDAGAKTSRVGNLVAMLSIRYVLSLADPYPVVVKQFLQFCLILIYPAWVVGDPVQPRGVPRDLFGAVGDLLAGPRVDEGDPAPGVRGQPAQVARQARDTEEASSICPRVGRTPV